MENSQQQPENSNTFEAQGNNTSSQQESQEIQKSPVPSQNFYYQSQQPQPQQYHQHLPVPQQLNQSSQIPQNYQRTFANFQQPQQQMYGQQQHSQQQAPNQFYQQQQQIPQGYYQPQGQQFVGQQIPGGMPPPMAPPMYPPVQQQFNQQPQFQPFNPQMAQFDTYRIKLFNELLDKKYQEILNPQDKKTYEHNDQIYRMGFWACLGSIPINFYYGIQIGKTPAKAKSFMMKSLGYTTFSTVLFALSIFRYQEMSKEFSTRYLTNLSNQDLEQRVHQSKGIYMHSTQYQNPNLYQQQLGQMPQYQLPQYQQQQQPQSMQPPQTQIPKPQVLPQPQVAQVAQPQMQQQIQQQLPVLDVPKPSPIPIQNPYGQFEQGQQHYQGQVVHKNSNPYI